MIAATTLSDLCLHIVDCEHKTSPVDPSGEYFAVGTPAMRNNRIDYSQARRISRSTFDLWTRRLTPVAGDLLFAREAPVGPVVLIPPAQNVAPGQRTVLLRPNPALADSRFLYYLLSSPQQQELIARKAAGSTVAHLNVADIRSFEVRLPPLPEQVAVAEVLGALDDKIASNLRLVQMLADLGSLRLRTALRMNQDVEPLSRLSLFISRGITPSYTESPEGAVVLNQKCVRDGRVSLLLARRTLESKVSADKVLRPDDVLVNSTGQGTLGRIARWTGSERATVDSHITIVRPDPERVDPACFGVAMLQLQTDVEALAEGSTGQTELARAQLARLEVALPKRDAQVGVGRSVREYGRFADGLLGENLKIEEVRDSLIPPLMSGKLRVRDAEKTLEKVL